LADFGIDQFTTKYLLLVDVPRAGITDLKKQQLESDSMYPEGNSYSWVIMKKSVQWNDATVKEFAFEFIEGHKRGDLL
jgi:hypothetical protein